MNNGITEGFNSIVQAAKSKARGFRNVNYFNGIIYLLPGKIDSKKYQYVVCTY
jgi:transposase